MRISVRSQIKKCLATGSYRRVLPFSAFLTLVLFAASHSKAQFSDGFDGTVIDTSIWTVHAATGFSITQNDDLTFDADPINDPADDIYPAMNFDNQWDRCYLRSVSFARNQGALGVCITFDVSTLNTTSWYIGVIPTGTDPSMEPPDKFAYAWHYFFSIPINILHFMEDPYGLISLPA